MQDFFNNLNWVMLLKAFVVGGLICIIGQILIDKTRKHEKNFKIYGFCSHGRIV